MGAQQPRSIKGQVKGTLAQLTQGYSPARALDAPAEAMLLLLLLPFALLGSINCCSSKYYGATTGRHFCTNIRSKENIREIRMHRNQVRILGVQVRYGKNWDDLFGSSRGDTFTFPLEEDEHVVEIHGSYLGPIRNLILTTDSGYSYLLGKSMGSDFSDLPYPRDQVLKGFCGFFGPDGIRALSFVWDESKSNATNT